TQLQNYLRNQQLLLILDNFEQLVDARQSIMSLLTHVPGLTVLVTSRVRLNVRGEKLLLLDQLSLPSLSPLQEPSTSGTSIEAPAVDIAIESADDLLDHSEAFAFFVQRAQDVDPFFELDPQHTKAIVQICHLVEGLPLGIELAAGMLPLLSCMQLAEELTQSLATLSGDISDIPEDQRSLERVFERSWSLLSPEEQTLIARLSIFPNTFSFDAAQTIMNASRPLMMSLFNQSLLKRTNANRGRSTDGEIRYTLHRSIREFARRKLVQDAEQVQQTERDFAQYYLGFVADRMLQGLNSQKHMIVVRQLMTELDNIRAAWRRGVRQYLLQELFAAVDPLVHFMEAQGLYSDVFDLFYYAYTFYAKLDAEHGYTPQHPIYIFVGYIQAFMSMCMGRQGKQLESARYIRASFDKLESTDALLPKFACRLVFGSLQRAVNLQHAHKLLQEAVVMGGSYSLHTKVAATIFVGEVECLLGHYEQAQQTLLQIDDVFNEMDWGWGRFQCQRSLGIAHTRQGQYVDASICFEICMEITHEHNLKYALAESHIFMGDTLRLQGRLDDAAQSYREGLVIAQTYQFLPLMLHAQWGQGCLAAQIGDYAEARALLADNVGIHRQTLRTTVLPALGWVLMALGDFAEAEAYFQQICEMAESTHALPIGLEAQAGLACLAIKRTQQTGATNEPQTQQPTLDLQAIVQNPATATETRQRIRDHITI
ncbi:MAG: tetratricopeptide repeat protein, partial [Chloroflexota bacterium]